MSPIIVWSLLYWVLALGIGLIICWKVTDFKWFLYWVFMCIILYIAWMFLFPPRKTWNDEELINSKYNYADTRTFKNGGGTFTPLKAGYSSVNGDTVPGWGFDRGIDPQMYVDSTNRFTIWTTPIPKPRKDTVDWKKWFKENTDPITFDTSGTDKTYTFQL